MSKLIASALMVMGALTIVFATASALQIWAVNSHVSRAPSIAQLD